MKQKSDRIHCSLCNQNWLREPQNAEDDSKQRSFRVPWGEASCMVTNKAENKKEFMLSHFELQVHKRLSQLLQPRRVEDTP